MSDDTSDPYAGMKELLAAAQPELDARPITDVVAVVPGRIVGVFATADEAYDAALHEVGLDGPILIRGARGSVMRSMTLGLHVGPPRSHARALAAAGRPVPAAVPATLLLSTLATTSSVTPRLAEALSLPRVNFVTGTLSGHTFRMPMVLAEFSMPGRPGFVLRVSVEDRGEEGVDGHVGMDVIQYSKLVIDNGKLTAMISRPMVEKPDE